MCWGPRRDPGRDWVQTGGCSRTLRLYPISLSMGSVKGGFMVWSLVPMEISLAELSALSKATCRQGVQ